jgi:hypothetical protein
MLMNRSDIITLKRLSMVKDLVPIEDIPSSFKSDFNKFFYGKTLVKDKNSHLFAYPSDVKRWVHSLFIKYKV